LEINFLEEDEHPKPIIHFFLTSFVVNQQEAKKRQTLLDNLNRPIIRWKFMVKINHRLMDCEVMTMKGSIHHMSLTS